MKKLISILLSTLLVLPVIASFGITSAAETTFEDLWQAKLEYEKEKTISSGSQENMLFIYYEENWSFVLYTEQGKDLTYILEDWMHGGTGVNDELAWIGYLTLTSPELSQIAYKSQTKKIGVRGDEVRIFTGAAFRDLVRELKLTKEEIVSAYQKMKNDPESARELLSFLSDDQFAQFVNRTTYLTCPPDFVLDALYWEDEAEANMLLSLTGTIYLPEYGGATLTTELFGDGSGGAADFGGFFEGVDLTTTAFQYYFKNLQHYVYVQRPSYDAYMYGTVLPKMAYLEAEVARQLAAKETGDGAVQGVIVLALAIPALAATLILRRKRKI